MSGPTLTVEIAFVSNPYGTLTWTDVTNRVRGSLDFQRGRNYELGRTEAGTLSATLENLDGRFDPTNTSSPYYPYVLPYRPIRVRAVWLGTTYDLWRGYVERWPQKWSANGNYGTVDITAVDGFKTVLGAVFGQSYGQIVAGDTAYDYLAFGPGALAADSGTNTTAATVAAWATSTSSGITGNSDGNATSIAGQNNTGGALLNTVLANGTAVAATSCASTSIEGWFRVTSFPTDLTAKVPIIGEATGTGGGFFSGLLMERTGGNWTLFGQASYSNGPSGEVTLGYTLALNTTYHLAVSYDASRVGTVYVNGAALGTTYTPGAITGGVLCVAPFFVGQNATGLVMIADEVASYQSTLTAAQVAQHYVSGSNPALTAIYPQQDSGARIGAVLDTVAWPAAQRSLATGSSTLISTGSLSGSTALSVVQAAAEAELGNIFINGAGSFVFQNRGARNSATSSATFGEGAGEYPYQGDIVIEFDDTNIFNDVQVTQMGSSPTVTKESVDSTSRTTYGLRALSRTEPLATLADVVGQAATLLARFKDPRARVPQVTLEGRSCTTNFVQMLGREIGDLVTVNRRPLGAAAIGLHCFIDGVRHSIAADSWTTTFMLTPQYPNATY